MKTGTRTKLKAALGIVATYILFFAVSIVLYMECIFPFFKESEYKAWGAILVIPWLYGAQYLYYKLIKRYTSWWTVWKEKNDL